MLLAICSAPASCSRLAAAISCTSSAVFCDSNIGGLSSLSISEYLGVRARYLDSTDIGGSSYLAHVGHAAAAIAAGKCNIALVLLAGKAATSLPGQELPESSFEPIYGPTTVAEYALVASRHRYEFGTTAEQLAEIIGFFTLAEGAQAAPSGRKRPAPARIAHLAGKEELKEAPADPSHPVEKDQLDEEFERF